MERIYIDINCDVGEGIGNESDLFPHITSCNIACGAHAGDEKTMLRVVQLSNKFGIKVGAHPSYPDKENFGRRSMSMSKTDLKNSIRGQIGLLNSIVVREGMKLNHIKAHGALYNDIAAHRELSVDFLKAISDFREEVSVFVPPCSVISAEAKKNGFKIALEAFGDRGYQPDLSLVSRQFPDAVISQPETVLERVVSMVREQTVRSATGEDVSIRADTYCIHGDTPNALQILMYLSSELPKYNIYLKK